MQIHLPFPLPSYHFRSHHLNSALLESIRQSEILPAGPTFKSGASAWLGRTQPSVWKYSADNSQGDEANTGKMDSSQIGLFGLQLRIIYEQWRQTNEILSWLISHPHKGALLPTNGPWSCYFTTCGPKATWLCLHKFLKMCLMVFVKLMSWYHKHHFPDRGVEYRFCIFIYIEANTAKEPAVFIFHIWPNIVLFMFYLFHGGGEKFPSTGVRNG